MITTTRADAPTIRVPATPQEWLQSAALLHDYVEWLRAAVGVEPLDEQPALRRELEDLAAVYDGRGADWFVALDGDLVMGTIAVRYHADGSAELKRMYLRPIARGHGIADRLVERVIRAAAQRGCRRLWLESMRGVMEPALALYRRHGFEPARRPDRTIELDGMVVLERPLG